MELRNFRRRNEYRELQITLNGLGIYEEGMELHEMRQVIDALQISANESETNFSDNDMQHALRESELDFLPTTSGRVLNSTMMSFNTNSSPDASHAEKILVIAEVHHAMDWSPPNERLARNRVASASMIVDNENISNDLESNEDLFGVDCKCDQGVCIFDKINNNKDNSTNSSKESAKISMKSSHEMHGLSSERKVHDSGFVMGHETPHSSFNNTTDNTPPAEQSTLEVSNNLHEIRGPVSVRRVHDSGFNISPEKSYSIENSLEDNLANGLEKSL